MNPDEQRSSVFSVISCSINPPVKRSPRTGVLNRRKRSKQRKRARELVRLIYERIFHWCWEDLARHVHVVGRLENVEFDEQHSSVFSVIFCSINPPVKRSPRTGVLNRRKRSKQRKRARELVRLIYELIFHWYLEDLASPCRRAA